MTRITFIPRYNRTYFTFLPVAAPVLTSYFIDLMNSFLRRPYDFWIHRSLMARFGCFRRFASERYNLASGHLYRLPFLDVCTVSMRYHLGDDPSKHVTRNESGSSSTVSGFMKFSTIPPASVLQNVNTLSHSTCTFVHSKLGSHFMTRPVLQPTGSPKASSVF